MVISPDMRMDPAVECTHCGVVMSSWSVPSSPVRYFQCPFCNRTHSSHYGEVFRSRAGARLLARPARAAAPTGIPMALPEEARWATIRSAANRWYARLEADERRHTPATGTPRPLARVAEPAPAPRAAPKPIPLTVAVAAGPARERDPLADLEIDVELPAEAPAPALAVAGARR
jgi:hypothetical protein